MADFEFKFDRSRFQNPKIMDRKINRALFGVCKYWDGRVESWMKQNAPWRDRTSNARNGLRAEAAKLGGRGFDANSFAIILSHGVTYGIYLELPHTHEGTDEDGNTYSYTIGPYPVIVPAIERFAPKVLKTCTKLLNRLGGG